MYKYSMTQWIVGNENIEESFQRLQKYGYDGIEFAAEPYSLEGEKMRRLMNNYQLICTSLCGIFNDERDLTAGEPKKAEKAIQYFRLKEINLLRKVSEEVTICQTINFSTLLCRMGYHVYGLRKIII